MKKNPKKIYSIKKPIPLTRRRRDFKFFEHICSEQCSILERNIIEDNPHKFVITNDSVLVKDQSPLLVPLYFEFKRKNEVGEKCCYLSPCGIVFCNLKEVYDYLKVTSSKLNINQFCFEQRIELYRDHSYFQVYAFKKDISNNLESIPIQGINEHNPQFWDNFKYVKESKFSIDQNLIKEIFDEENLAYCDCDDCSDSNKCKCRQLTIQENKLIDVNNKFGYEFNLMLNKPSTAIYECNIRCKCSKNCLNRVVQNGIKLRLQVFKTTNRGFGLRTLNDIPKGFFVCSYEGDIVQKKRSHLESNDNSYLMNLNYCHVLKNLKESSENNSNDTQQISINNEMEINDEIDKIGEETPEINDEIDENREEMKDKKVDINCLDNLVDASDFNILETDSSSSSFSDITNTDRSDDTSNDNISIDEDLISIDEFNSDDHPNNSSTIADYLIDSKEYGNISRFINHSCNPNLSVYPIFIRTQNPNFPTLAFFANRDIKAFTELSIDYFCDNEKGLINFKCHCKSSKCINRIKS